MELGVVEIIMMVIVVGVVGMVGVQILGGGALDNCDGLSGNATAGTGWAGKCKSVQQTSADGYGLLILVVVIAAAAAVLLAVRLFGVI